MPKKLLPPRFIVLTLGLPYPLDSPRIAVKTEAQPNRWTHHIVIGSADESFLVKGTIPHSVWNNQEDETVMIGITVK